MRLVAGNAGKQRVVGWHGSETSTLGSWAIDLHAVTKIYYFLLPVQVGCSKQVLAQRSIAK